jgi:hypothetical protein
VSAVPGLLVTPFIVLPSYYQNIDSYLAIMRYWWTGNRFEKATSQADQEEKPLIESKKPINGNQSKIFYP